MKRKRIPPQRGAALVTRTARPSPLVTNDASIATDAAAVEAELDDALAATFPASDPVAVDPPSAPGARTRDRVASRKQGKGR